MVLLRGKGARARYPATDYWSLVWRQWQQRLNRLLSLAERRTHTPTTRLLHTTLTCVVLTLRCCLLLVFCFCCALVCVALVFCLSALLLLSTSIIFITCRFCYYLLVASPSFVSVSCLHTCWFATLAATLARKLLSVFVPKCCAIFIVGRYMSQADRVAAARSGSYSCAAYIHRTIVCRHPDAPKLHPRSRCCTGCSDYLIINFRRLVLTQPVVYLTNPVFSYWCDRVINILADQLNDQPHGQIINRFTSITLPQEVINSVIRRYSDQE